MVRRDTENVREFINVLDTHLAILDESEYDFTRGHFVLDGVHRDNGTPVRVEVELKFEQARSDNLDQLAFNFNTQMDVDVLKEMVGGTITAVSEAPDGSFQIQCKYKKER